MLLIPDYSSVITSSTKSLLLLPASTFTDFWDYIYSGRIYKTGTGEEITNPDPDTKKQIDANNKQSELQLKISDAITTGDLLRFWPSNGLKAIDPNDYNYTKGLQKAKVIEKKLGDRSTSIFSQNGDKTTKDLWQTQSFQALHPELNLK